MHLPRLITFLLLLVAPTIFTETNECSGSLPMAEVACAPSGIVGLAASMRLQAPIAI